MRMMLIAGILSQSLPLAQVAGVDSSIVSLVGNGVTIVVLAWYVIYDVRVRTPAMLTAFTFQQDQLRNTFTAEQSNVHEHYNGILNAMRETFTKEQALSRAAFSAEQTAIRDRYDKELSDMRQMLFESVTSMRTAVHDVKDTANRLMLKKELKTMQEEEK